MKRAAMLAAGICLAAAPSSSPAASPPDPSLAALALPAHTRSWKIAYTAHNGQRRAAIVLLPAWYGPKKHPYVPLVISPHGRNVAAATNAKLWGDMPSAGGFAVVNPDGQGRVLQGYSWGAPGQIEDLARMPQIVQHALPWIRVNPKKVYVVGGSMGGQEALLLLARHPKLLAGAISIDGVPDFALQYKHFPELNADCNAACQKGWGGPVGTVVQALARREVGGTPATAPKAFAARSAIDSASALARSCVPLQVWWTGTDKIVRDSDQQSGRLVTRVRQLNASANLEAYTGTWAHTTIMHGNVLLPYMLAQWGLMPASFAQMPSRYGPLVKPLPGPARPCVK